MSNPMSKSYYSEVKRFCAQVNQCVNIKQEQDIVEKELDDVLKYIFDNKLYSKEYVLNVNFPTMEFKESNGYKFCRQGIKNFKTTFVKIENGRYINTDSDIVYDSNPDTDVYLASQGFVTFVPLKVEQTSYEHLKKFLE